MKHLALLVVLFVVAQSVAAAGIIRIADGDCASLSAAAASARGSEPSLIVLARKGTYGYCPLSIAGNISIDGAGAALGVRATQTVPAISIAAGASLKMRNVNFVQDGDSFICSVGLAPPNCESLPPAIIANRGDLVLESISAANVEYGSDAFIHNFGSLSIRNATFVNNIDWLGSPLVGIDGAASNANIENSTFIGNTGMFACAGFSENASFSAHCTGQLTLANSVLASTNTFKTLCGTSDPFSFPANGIQPVSEGGNITTDNSCGLNAPNDQVVGDVRFADFGDHGGVVGTQALASDSPAVGNGIAGNCEATDARGAARGQSHCDSGAYEFGGGQGQLSMSGFTGLYYDAAHDGHYVTVQRLDSGSALVVWNTFNQQGMPAWVYGIGTTNGNQIHVTHVAQNIGGTLHPGGVVTGASPVLWGSLDFNVPDCYSATLNYESTQPAFGSGSVDLTRIVFVEGLDCSD